ncbi:MAG TPA: UDP-glucose 4-epimerase GalE [Terriglobales bacterium]|nr:UDP-glucose 4-epimerase GalE [Terriglobales bacterium]
MRVLVTGGAGYIGSVLTEELVAAGHAVIVYDNLAKGHRDAVQAPARFVPGDILDADHLARTFASERIEAVVHMAADSLVGESMTDPARYYRTNLVGGLRLLDAMRAAGVGLLVFSSTAAVYGNAEKQPIEEDAPTAPTNPYGETKLAFERAVGWYARAHGLRGTSVRYFNAAGATARNGERHDPETHLIPLLLQVATGERPDVTVFGDDYPTPDGTCIRDYVHVSDLGRAHVLALEALAGPGAGPVYNLGAGGGASVREVIDVARRVTGHPIPVRVGARRPGDPPRLVASSARAAAELAWRPTRQDLGTIVESAWRWMSGRRRAA